MPKYCQKSSVLCLYAGNDDKRAYLMKTIHNRQEDKDHKESSAITDHISSSLQPMTSQDHFRIKTRAYKNTIKWKLSLWSLEY